MIQTLLFSGFIISILVELYKTLQEPKKLKVMREREIQDKLPRVKK